MNVKQLIAVVAIFAAADSTFAEGSVNSQETHVTSPKTRAEVIAELVQARAQGLMNYNDATSAYPTQTK